MFSSVGSPIVPLAGATVPRPVYPRQEIMSLPVGQCISLGLAKMHLRVTHTWQDEYITFLIAVAAEAVESYISKFLVQRKIRLWFDFIPGVGNDDFAYNTGGTAQVPVRYANVGMFRSFALQRLPVLSFDRFGYIDDAGTDQTWDPSNYIVDIVDKNMTAKITLQRGAVWPVDLQIAHAIELEYTAGYGPGYWNASTAYAVGNIVNNAGNAYTCTTAGTSAASPATGPSGTGIGIVDGAAVWSYASVATTIPYAMKQAMLIMLAAMWSNRGDNKDPQSDVLNFPGVRGLLDTLRVMTI